MELINAGFKYNSPDKDKSHFPKEKEVSFNALKDQRKYNKDIVARGYTKEIKEIEGYHKLAINDLKPKELKKFEHDDDIEYKYSTNKEKINTQYELIHLEINKLAD